MSELFTLLRGKKTVIFNTLALAVALLQYYGGPLPAVDAEQFGAAVAVINLGLRFVTKTAIFTK